MHDAERDDLNRQLQIQRCRNRFWILISILAIGLIAPTACFGWGYYSGSSVTSNRTVYGWGVTDVTPNSGSMTHDAWVSTTLTSPKGRTASIVNKYAMNMVRADVVLYPDDTDLGIYCVQSFHTGKCRVMGFLLNNVGSSSSVVVRPTLTLSSPEYVPLRAQGTQQGANSMQIGASGNPPGGTYSWSTSSNKITLSNTNLAVVTVTSVSQSSAVGDVSVQVTYTKGADVTASKSITVVKPTSVVLNGSPTYDPAGYSCGGGHTSYLRTIPYYSSYSPGGGTIRGFSLYWEESYSTPQGNCPFTLQTRNVISEGLNDDFFLCHSTCYSGGSCSETATQTMKVNGFIVRTNNVTWTCTDATVTKVN